MPPKRPASPNASPTLSPSPTTQDPTFSSPIQDRASTFIAAFVPLPTSPQSFDGGGTSNSDTAARSAAKVLQRHSRFRDADHKIAAWRGVGRQRKIGQLGGGGEGMVQGGWDDDGEKWAGKKVLEVLEEGGDAGDVLGGLVVARWYGGKMLGPVRFEHIKNCAREAISKHKATMPSASGAKRIKTRVITSDGPHLNSGTAISEHDKGERARLIEELPERDKSIVVLRQLLAEKKGETAPSSSATSQSPAKVVEYDRMSLQELKRIEKVRDASISWILKGIEKAEEKEEMREGWDMMEKAMAKEKDIEEGGDPGNKGGDDDG